MGTVRKTMKNYRQTKGVLYLRGLCQFTKAQFKSVCARRGDEMTRVVEALMSAYVKEPEKFHVKKRG